ncbi:peptidoglycan recognition protein 1-like [Macrosteles quadrilineatus]|uniref:peptidoglycan recognition protein 1-like n=1 Tax=Macrosteles quadrilineatus TaxID=74068 RepID=UPI0023E34934|nr:peptidoglycan recognition protein 1-like [Macrosteles quadrilineatus]
MEPRRNAIETPGYAPYAVDPVAPSPEVDGPELKNLVIIPRSQWCKIPPKWKDPLATPVSYVYSTFTRKSHCFSHDQCFAELQYLHYRSTKYGDKPDIVYNFLIGGDGTVYEGRGWTANVNLPKRYQTIQNQCISIAMMGTFQYRPPSAAMKKAQNMLIKYGMDNNYIKKKITHFTT